MLTSIGLVLRNLISCVRLKLNFKQKVLICRVFQLDSFDIKRADVYGVVTFIEALAFECFIRCLWGDLREPWEIGLICNDGLTELGDLVCSKLKGGEIL